MSARWAFVRGFAGLWGVALARVDVGPVGLGLVVLERLAGGLGAAFGGELAGVFRVVEVGAEREVERGVFLGLSLGIGRECKGRGADEHGRSAG